MTPGMPVIADEMEMVSRDIESFEKDRGIEPDNGAVVSVYV